MRKDSILQQYYYKKLPKYQDKGEVVLPPYPIPRSSFMGDEVIPNPIPKDEFIKRSKQSIPQAVDFWKNWYAGRQTLPQFKDVSERRLKLLEQPVDVQYLQPTQLMKENTVGRYIPETKKMELVDPLNQYVSKGSRDDIDRFNEFMSVATGIPVVGHELFHKLGYQAPQGDINTLTRYPHSPSFERTSKPIFAPPKQYGIPKEQYEYYALEQMIPSAKRNKRSEFPSEKTTIFHPEMEAGVAMLRMAENMDPTKTYTIEDVKPIIDKYSKYKQDNLKYDLPPEGYESQHNSWFINRMFQMLGNDPDKIAKYLNSVARTTQRKPLDFAKHGGLVKAQYGIPSARELANQNQSYSTDAALAAKMQADAQAARLKSKMLSAAKESYIAPARQSTPQEEQMRMIRNRTYQAQNAPYTRMNAQGDLSRAIPNVSMSGQPDVRTPEARWQKGSEHMMNAMEVAGAMQGLGYLGRQGYNAARAALAESMESGLLSNTYKINPWRFKPNPEAYYRGVGKEGIEDIFESGVIRSKKQNAYPEPYFSKGVIGDKYAKGYFAELTNEPMKGVGSFSTGDLIQTPANTVGINNPNLKLYQKDWLRGYKEVPKPTRFTTTSKGLSTPTADELPEYLRPYIGRTEPEYSDAEKIWRSWFKGEAPPMPTKSVEPPTSSSATTSTSVSAPGQRMDVTFGRPGDDVTNTSIEDLVDLYRVQEKGFDINSNTIAQMEKAAAEGKLSPVQKMMLNNPYDRKRLMARDKYWGQWFEKDPKRLDYYIKDKGPESEILHVRIPRSEAPNYNIKNFESQQSVQGAPLEYYQRMSLSPETEFILPKDIIQGAKKYPLSEWERLIKEHKPWMGVLPFAGAAALSQKKKGGLIEDNRGQWAHPGKNTRISSPNITMQGVNYPVYAKASNGQQVMMQPGQDYYFPGADYVDEFPMMQNGGRYVDRLTRINTFVSYPKKKKKPIKRKLVQNIKPIELVEEVEQIPVEQPKPIIDYNQGSAIYAPTPGGGGGAFIGFKDKNGKITYVQPEDYQRMGVPGYGREYIESQYKQEYGGPLVEYYKGKMTGPNMFQDGGFNLIPPAVTNPYIQKAISSITNFLMPSSSQSQELEQGKIPTKISNDLLLKQAFKESQFNPKAVSPKGYKGLTQIGQDIIADYIKKTGVKNIDPFNPKHAKDIQEYAMNSLYNADFINKPNQSDQVRIAKTLAAYNWGRGNLSNFLNEKKKKGMDIYKSLDWMKDLPTETSDYINKILLNKSSDFNQQFQKSITNPTYKSIVSLYKEHGGQSNEGYYNYNYGVPEFEYGGPTRMNKFGYLEDAKAGGGEYHHGYYDQYGGDISIPQLPNMQKPLLQYYYNKIK